MLGELVGNTRRNHALEHATVSLLISRFGPNFRVVGRASGDGFFLWGDVPPEAVAECVHEGLARLQRGEGFWAVTPLCGTNLATAGILASLSTMAVIGDGDRKGKLSSAMVAGIAAVTLAQPLGRLIQKYVTTSPDLQDTKIISIESRPDGHFHKVKTRRTTGFAA